jgi:hypothetical protein
LKLSLSPICRPNDLISSLSAARYVQTTLWRSAGVFRFFHPDRTPSAKPTQPAQVFVNRIFRFACASHHPGAVGFVFSLARWRRCGYPEPRFGFVFTKRRVCRLGSKRRTTISENPFRKKRFFFACFANSSQFALASFLQNPLPIGFEAQNSASEARSAETLVFASWANATAQLTIDPASLAH